MMNLKELKQLFNDAAEKGKLDVFTDKFWTEVSHNNNLDVSEARKILESI